MSAHRLLLIVVLTAIGVEGNPILAEKYQDKVARTTDRYTCTIGNTALKQNAKHIALVVVNGTAARTGPSPLVEYQLTAPIFVGGVPVGRNITSRGQRFNGAEGESREGDRIAVWGAELLNSQRLDSWRYQYSFTDSQIKSVVDIAFGERKPVKIDRRSIALPAIVGNVDRSNARRWTVGRYNTQVIDYVRSGKEMSVFVNEEPSTINQLNEKFSFIVELPAEDGNDGVLYALNGQNESLSSAAPVRSAKRKTKKENPKNQNTANDSHTHGVLTLANNGKAIGCDTAKPSSSTISISCPQIDSVGLHQEAPQDSTHDH